MLLKLVVAQVCCNMCEKLCLKWNDFQENVNTAFGSMREDNEFADVTLACEDGQQIEAHKTQCQDEFRSLSGCVPEILTACRMHQISIAWCQNDAEIRGFPTMYTMGG